MNKTLMVILGITAVAILVAVVGYSNKSEDKMMQKEANDESEEMMQKEEQKNEGVMVGGAMMVQNLDIVANAMNANNVTTLVAAVSAAGLVDTLKGPGPFTVFAPTNAAFEKLPAGTVDTLLKPEMKADLVSVLTYHVVPGRYTSKDLKDGMELTTLQGQKLMIKNVNGKITVNGSAVVETADVISSNGVTFVIDSVLLPAAQ